MRSICELLLPLATASMVVDGSLKTGEGQVTAEVEQIAGGFKIDAEIEDLNLMRMNIISHMAGLPIMGVLNGDISLEWPKDSKARSGPSTSAPRDFAWVPGSFLEVRWAN